ncbi:RNA polymerase sigma factor [Paractinoplanes ferrugineus]|uniref:RNA polymerase sigma24 factor n=1 Tax=Paractinoplanes ferrugineus TaxID=113564 RepID=A0A919J675_9ACTN|nr:RNA polymerase sigma factor [Actinoplanes ferrugineus]GIE15596.1 RNA polymerase sigma24 factor [Actinoplanes ferrugineus]
MRRHAPARPPADIDLTDALGAAQDGDPRGFAALWRDLQPAVLRYLRVVVGDQAEDVASETWLQVIRDLDRFHGDVGSFRGWLFRIARHRALDEKRRQARRPRPDSTADPVGPDAAAVAADQAGTAWAVGLIATLPADQAEAVMLRVVAGLDVATAAQVLGKRPGAVRIATMRGLRRLATAMTGVTG